MELFQMRRLYRDLAASLRRQRRLEEPALDALEAQVLDALLRCDRHQTELSMLRATQRCLQGFVTRQRRWLGRAAFVRRLSPTLARQSNEAAVAELTRLLETRGFPATALRRTLSELAVVEQRLEEAQGRLHHALLAGALHLERLQTWLRVYRDRGALAP